MILSSTYAILMLIICVFINQSAYFLFGINSITFQLLAPLNEETFRFISVIKGKPLNFIFTLFLAVFEFIIYMNMITKQAGYLQIDMLLVRFWCVSLHFILLSIQLYGFHLYRKKKKKLYLVAGFVFAVALHYTWNARIIFLILPFFTT